MSSDHQLITLLRTNQAQTIDALLAQPVTALAQADQDAFREALATLITALLDHLETHEDRTSTLAAHIATIIRVGNCSLSQMMTLVQHLRTHFWSIINNTKHTTTPLAITISDVEQMEQLFMRLAHIIGDHFDEQLRQATNELVWQNEQLDAQNRVISELSTPILPVHEGIIVLPLVGALDSRRATQIMENLLEAITDYQSDMVIIDITGVPMVDTSVANYILQAARAANLVGASIILVGIGAEIAQTMVQLGVDLSRITTLANLQEGLQYAFRRRGYSIT